MTQGFKKGGRPLKRVMPMQGASSEQEGTQRQRRGFRGGEARTVRVPEATERVPESGPG